MSKEKKKSCVLYIRGLSVNLKNQFKASCARRGKSMKQGIEELMKQAVLK